MVLLGMHTVYHHVISSRHMNLSNARHRWQRLCCWGCIQYIIMVSAVGTHLSSRTHVPCQKCPLQASTSVECPMYAEPHPVPHQQRLQSHACRGQRVLMAGCACSVWFWQERGAGVRLYKTHSRQPRAVHRHKVCAAALALHGGHRRKGTAGVRSCLAAKLLVMLVRQSSFCCMCMNVIRHCMAALALRKVCLSQCLFYVLGMRVALHVGLHGGAVN